MRFIIMLISVLLVSLLVFQNFQAKRTAPDARYGGNQPFDVRQRAGDVDRIVGEAVAARRRTIDGQPGQ